MNKNKTRETITLYRDVLVRLNIPKAEHPHEERLPNIFRLRQMRALAHCHQALDKVDKFLEEDRLGKAHRWLGFVQGVLWSFNIYTIDDLKSHNQPDADAVESNSRSSGLDFPRGDL